MTIELDQSNLRFDNISGLQLESQAYHDVSQALVDTFTTNGAAKFGLSCSVFAKYAEDQEYLRGVLWAAAYDREDIQFKLPNEIYKYTGNLTNVDGTNNSTSVVTNAEVVAGSNIFTLSATRRPDANGIKQGTMISFGTNPQLYVVNQYTASSGEVKVFPKVRETIAANTPINITNIQLRAYITNNPNAEAIPGNDQFVRFDLELSERIV